MRYLVTLALGLFLCQSYAHACRGVGTWNNLFFETIPVPRPDADLIAIVSVSDIKDRSGGATVTAMARVIQVLKTTDARIKQDEQFSMQLENSSCGPYPMGSSTGTIIAKVSTNSKGRPVLHPYTYTYRDNRISSPLILPDGFEMNPRPIQIGKEIPLGYAVVLVGLTGKTPIGSLMLDHTQRISMHPSFPERSNTIVAFTVPLGIKQLSLSGIGVRQWFEGKPSYTVVEKVQSKKVDIDRPGLYYTVTLDTDHPGKFIDTPLPDQLKQFRLDYAETAARLEAINFKWPNQ